MSTVAAPESTAPTARVRARRGTAVLTSGCDGYPAGTTGIVAGHREGCAILVIDHPERVARWAQPRSRILVPATLLAVL